jgi:hypothetical protein
MNGRDRRRICASYYGQAAIIRLIPPERTDTGSVIVGEHLGSGVAGQIDGGVIETPGRADGGVLRIFEGLRRMGFPHSPNSGFPDFSEWWRHRNPAPKTSFGSDRQGRVRQAGPHSRMLCWHPREGFGYPDRSDRRAEHERRPTDGNIP